MWLWAKCSDGSLITNRVFMNIDKFWTNISIWLECKSRKDIYLMKQHRGHSVFLGLVKGERIVNLCPSELIQSNELGNRAEKPPGSWSPLLAEAWLWIWLPFCCPWAHGQAQPRPQQSRHTSICSGQFSFCLCLVLTAVRIPDEKYFPNFLYFIIKEFPFPLWWLSMSHLCFFGIQKSIVSCPEIQ